MSARHSKLKELWQRRRAKWQAMKALGMPFGLFEEPTGIIFQPRRYMERTLVIEPDVEWSKGKTLAYFRQGPEEGLPSGMRFVGRVVPEKSSIVPAVGIPTTGWYDNDECESWKDGSGLVWGVVIQLPGKGRWCRYLAGYQYGGVDCGPVVDCSKIFTEENTGSLNLEINDAARRAARAADQMAQDAAEEEKEYKRREWQELNQV